MAFLDTYSDTQRVTIGDPDLGYWVELRKILLQGDKEAAERALISSSIKPGDTSGMTMNMDHVSYRELLLLASIVAWNLDDDDGVWPITLASVKRLPAPVFDQLAALVDESNAVTAKERRQFPDPGVGGDPHARNGRPAEPRDVLGRAADVAAPGAAPGGSEKAPVA